MPAYRNQIQKALKRNDAISVNHRVTEFLASYFDIIFALNKIPHPGEKRLVEIALSKCNILPHVFERNICDLVKLAGEMNDDINKVINQLVEQLTILPQEEGLIDDHSCRVSNCLPAAYSNAS